MIDRIAVDSNAAIEHMRNAGVVLPPLLDAREIMLPLPVLGELLAGALASNNVAANLRVVEDLATRWTVLFPTIQTARIYGELRAYLRSSIGPTKVNDL